MKLGRTLSLFGYKAAFDGLRVESAGRALLDALGSDDENVRTIAGMFLVKSGRKSIPLLLEALAARRHTETVLTMLGDIAAPETVPDIERYVDDPDPAVARAAREALEILRRNASSRPSVSSRTK